MTQRITRAMLDTQIRNLNRVSGTPLEHRNANTGESNVGHYHLDICNGGYLLVQTGNKLGGTHRVSLTCGTKREIYSQIYAILNVLYQNKGVNNV